MFKVLNRLAWMLSLTFGYLLVFFIGMAVDALDYGGFDNDVFLVWLILTFVFGSVIKKFFLSKTFIENSLQLSGYAKELKEPIISPEDIKTERQKDDLDSILDEDPAKTDQTPEENLEKLNVSPLSKFAEPAINILEEKVFKPSLEKQEELKQKVGDKFSFKSPSVKEEESDSVVPTETEPITREEPKGPNFFQRFFAENALAKIGGIMLFLAVLFLLQLVYTKIGPIGKLMIGFLVGFLVFMVGLWLENKKYKKESRILFGTAILINYLVILSGRYLIGESLFADKTILNESMTFFLLIVNTVFAVTVAMAYNSYVILFFSFIVAYLNPFIISDRIVLTNYTILAYGLAVSFGGILLAYYYKNRSKFYSYNILNAAFIGGNVLILFAPFDTLNDWLLKLAALTFLSFLCILAASRNNHKKLIGWYFGGAYIFLASIMLYGNFGLGDLFSGVMLTIGCLIVLAMSFLGGAYLFVLTSFRSIFFLLLVPLVFVWGLFVGDVFALSDLAFVSVGVLVFYLAVFGKLYSKLTVAMTYVFFFAIGFFVLLLSGFWSDVGYFALERFGLSETAYQVQVYGIIASAFIFLVSSYVLSRKKDLEYLYALGTILSIAVLIPIIEREGALKIASIMSIALFMLFNIALPFINKNILSASARNLVFGMLAGVLFAVGEFFYFWFGDADQSKMTLGLSFLALAVVYFFVGFLMHLNISSMRRINKSKEGESVSRSDPVYAILGIAISLFSLAIAYVFSKHSEVVSAVWLFESTLLYYFYSKKQDFSMYLGAFVLMLIGLIKMILFVPLVSQKEFSTLIPLLVIFVSFVASLRFLEDENGKIRSAHDLGHVVGMILIGMVLSRIIPDHNYGWLIFGLSIYALILSVIYSLIYSAGAKKAYAAFLALLFFWQIAQLDHTFSYLERINLGEYKVLQHMSTFLLASSVLLFNILPKSFNLMANINKSVSQVLNGLFALYIFFITTQFVYYLFGENEFIITIYWGVLALAFLSYGIQHDVIKWRTIGLYILSLTTIKILAYDIWSGLDDAVMRVIALMLVGGIMIGISILYSKKYGGHLKGEFDLDNLRGVPISGNKDEK